MLASAQLLKSNGTWRHSLSPKWRTDRCNGCALSISWFRCRSGAAIGCTRHTGTNCVTAKNANIRIRRKTLSSPAEQHMARSVGKSALPTLRTRSRAGTTGENEPNRSQCRTSHEQPSASRGRSRQHALRKTCLVESELFHKVDTFRARVRGSVLQTLGTFVHSYSHSYSYSCRYSYRYSLTGWNWTVSLLVCLIRSQTLTEIRKSVGKIFKNIFEN